MPSSDGSADSTTTTETTIPNAEELKAIYEPIRNQDARIADAVRILDAIIARDTEEDLSTAELLASIEALRNLIIGNTKEILYLHNLIGKLVFELVDQGIEIQSKELINELELYVKK